jgi:DNA polymerase III subunit epsilon
MGLKDWLGISGKAAPEQVAPQGKERWVVLDVETSGLDADTAQLLAVACVGLQVDWQNKTLNISPGDSFEIVIQPRTPVQDVGKPGWQALPLLRDFLADAPLLAFHAWFDQLLLERHFLSELGKPLPNPWLDIEKLCSVTQPDVKAEDLDQWLEVFNITCPTRHEAAADAFAEAEILQRIWPQLMKELGTKPSWQGLKKLEKLDQWLSR